MFSKARLMLTFSQLLTFLLVGISANSRETDSLSLVAFLNANQESSLSWDTSKSIDTWSGVKLNSNERVEEINLEFFQLKTVPAEIGQLSELKSLALRYNKITSVAKEIGDLTTLEKLNLSANKLTTIPGEIGQLSNLVELNLNANQLSSIPGDIGKLSKLENLYLSDNADLSELPSSIGDLEILKKIIITNTSLTTLPPSFGDLGDLEYINLKGNALSSLPDEIETIVPKNFQGVFTYVNFSENFLSRTNLSTKVTDWLDRYVPDWEGGQQAVSVSQGYSGTKSMKEVSFSLKGKCITVNTSGVLSVFDAKGRLLQKEEIIGHTQTLHLSEGNYIVRFSSMGSVETRKITIY